MTKTIVLVALLAAAGCSKKKGSDCDAAIDKGMANFTAQLKPATTPQMQDNMLNMAQKLKATLTQRCNEDKWPPEVVSCFTTVAKMKDMQACQTKLNPEQSAKLINEIRQVMLGAMGGVRMPSDVAGHPPMLAGSGSAPPAPAGSPPTPAGSATGPAGSTPAPAGSATGTAGSTATPAGSTAAPTGSTATPAGSTATPTGSAAAPAGSAAPAPGGW